MAFTFCNRGLYTFINSATTGATDIRQAVFTGTLPATATIRDWNFMSDLIADAGSAESALVPRQDLAGVTVSEDDTGDKVTITATAPNYGAIAAGETLSFVAYYVEGASDAARALIGVDDLTDLATNGSTITGPALSIAIQAASGS